MTCFGSVVGHLCLLPPYRPNLAGANTERVRKVALALSCDFTGREAAQVEVGTDVIEIRGVQMLVLGQCVCVCVCERDTFQM